MAINFKKLWCVLVGHTWWEYWHCDGIVNSRPPIDHCVKCGSEKPHNLIGCNCSYCKFGKFKSGK